MIREAKISDAKDIADLNREVQSLHHDLFPDVFKPYSYEKTEFAFKQILKNKSMGAFISYNVMEKPDGYILFEKKIHKDTAFCHQSKSLYVHHISVAKNSQSKGLGKQLMNQVILKAKSLKIPYIELDVWSLNVHAKKFFISQGFKVFNEKMRINLD